MHRMSLYYTSLLYIELLAVVFSGVSCQGWIDDPTNLDLFVPSSRGELTAIVRIGDGPATNFVADEVAASFRPGSMERELVMYARSYDLDETLAFVLELEGMNIPGEMDLSNQGVLYLEPEMGAGGGDLRFDGPPSGMLELDGPVGVGSSLSGRFRFTIPGYDAARLGEEIIASLEGSFFLSQVEAGGAL